MLEFSNDTEQMWWGTSPESRDYLFKILPSVLISFDLFLNFTLDENTLPITFIDESHYINYTIKRFTNHYNMKLDQSHNKILIESFIENKKAMRQMRRVLRNQKKC